MLPSTDQSQRYHIEGLLGEGGFGRVYRATLQGAGGFSKTVAIKVLHDPSPPASLLQRFRDEARLLALVRDRAIVAVDPPVTIREHWALVMELVEGASCDALVQDQGKIPPGPVVEIVGEIARVLDKVYQAPGPDGRPLKLLHRDIKPENIQLTRDGEVKLLDFGIAKADFDAREYKTRNAVRGTPGYIAPERLQGIDGPIADVFSLGVTMHVMLTGEKPSMFGRFPSDRTPTMDVTQEIGEQPSLQTGTANADAEIQELLALAARMRDVEHTDRPSARDIERACREIRQRSSSVWLREWAEANVPAQTTLRTDDWSGSVVTLDGRSTDITRPLPSAPVPEPQVPVPPQPTAPPPRIGPLLAGIGLVVALGVVGVGAIATSGLAYWLTNAVGTVGTVDTVDTVDTVAPVAPVAPAPVPPEPAIAAPTPVPLPQPDVIASPPPAIPQPAPHAPVAAQPNVAPAPPTPAPTEAPAPAQEAAPVGPLSPVTFSSRPLGATVSIDGTARGSTPLRVDLPAGTHLAVLIAPDGTRTEHTIKVGARAAARYLWDIGADEWEAGY